jgi:hypothetical protein
MSVGWIDGLFRNVIQDLKNWNFFLLNINFGRFPFLTPAAFYM